MERSRIKLNFPSRDVLKGTWEGQLKRGQFFIPSNQMIPVGTGITLVLVVPDAPAAFLLDGDVNLAREARHCTPGQQPGVGIDIHVTRRIRKAADAFFAGTYDKASLVMEGQRQAAQNAARAPRDRKLNTAQAGSVVAVRRLVKADAGPKPEQRKPEEVHAAAVAFIKATDGVTFYEVLDCDEDATRKPLRHNYIKAVKQFHPDNYYERVSAETLQLLEVAYQRLTKAYETLIDSAQRQKYDGWLAAQRKKAGVAAPKPRRPKTPEPPQSARAPQQAQPGQVRRPPPAGRVQQQAARAPHASGTRAPRQVPQAQVGRPAGSSRQGQAPPSRQGQAPPSRQGQASPSRQGQAQPSRQGPRSGQSGSRPAQQSTVVRLPKGAPRPAAHGVVRKPTRPPGDSSGSGQAPPPTGARVMKRKKP